MEFEGNGSPTPLLRVLHGTCPRALPAPSTPTKYSVLSPGSAGDTKQLQR